MKKLINKIKSLFMNTQEPLFFHGGYEEWGVKIINNLPRVTFAGVIEGDNLLIGVARCSKSDNYNKKLGRKLSLKRATDSPQIIVPIPDKNRSLQLFNKICDGLTVTYCQDARMIKSK